MRITDYVAIDLETTGVSVSKDKIIEVGLIKVKDSHIVEMFSCIINPNMPVSDEILNLTGIDEDEIKSAKYIQDVIREIVEFCDGFDLLGHNTIFDYSFVRKEANNAGLLYFLYRSLVTIFTLASVHCALKIVAKRSCHGVLYSKYIFFSVPYASSSLSNIFCNLLSVIPLSLFFYRLVDIHSTLLLQRSTSFCLL